MKSRSDLNQRIAKRLAKAEVWILVPTPYSSQSNSRRIYFTQNHKKRKKSQWAVSPKQFASITYKKIANSDRIIFTNDCLLQIADSFYRARRCRYAVYFHQWKKRENDLHFVSNKLLLSLVFCTTECNTTNAFKDKLSNKVCTVIPISTFHSILPLGQQASPPPWSVAIWNRYSLNTAFGHNWTTLCLKHALASRIVKNIMKRNVRVTKVNASFRRKA